MRPVSPLILLCTLLCSCGVFQPGAKPAGNSPGDEMVETGYGQRRRDDVTEAISKVNMDDARNYSDMYDYLRGRVPGVTVNGKTIRIRSTDTVNGTADPLILVDGVPVDDLSDINPGDVKSVEVLKDSSASIYGIRGANGVILITTGQE